MRDDAVEGAYTFRLSYVVLPLAILLLSVILTAVFYFRLPDEVAYRFQSGGLPDKLASRGAVVLWMLLPQLLLTLVAGAITLGVTRLAARFIQPEGTWIKPERIISLMGNVVALPQIILGFAMLDIFLYNSYQIHLLPLWLFALIAMVVGGIILGIFFLQALWQVWRASKE